MVIEKVKRFDERQARQLLDLLQAQKSALASFRQPTGAMAMLGFARKFRDAPRSTADWMKYLRGMKFYARPNRPALGQTHVRPKTC